MYFKARQEKVNVGHLCRLCCTDYSAKRAKRPSVIREKRHIF